MENTRTRHTPMHTYNISQRQQVNNSSLWHRRRLLEMIVGGEITLFESFPSPPFPAVPPSSHSPFPCLSLPFPLSSFPPVSVPFPFPLPPPLKSSYGVWGSAKLPQRVRAHPGRQTLLVHFQTEVSAPFVTCIMTHSQFLLYIFAVYNGDKMPMQKLTHLTVSKKTCAYKFVGGATSGSRLHNFLAEAQRGRSPLCSMQLAPMVFSLKEINVEECINQSTKVPKLNNGHICSW